MEEARNFAPITEEIFDSTEFASAWYIGNCTEIEKRKYWGDGFTPLSNVVYLWVGKNRNRLRGLTLEEQEEIMIAEGVITRDDI